MQWLRCGTLIDGSGGEVRTDVAVGIKSGRVSKLVDWSELPTVDREIAVDYSSKTVVPGFIDAHVHLLFTCDVDHNATRSRFESSSDAELTIAGARNAQDTLLGGVTTVRDCGDARFIVRSLRDAVRDRTLVGPRILTAGAPITTTTGHLHWCGNTADSPDEIRNSVRKLCAEGVDLIKIMSSGGAMTHESNALQPQYRDVEMRIAVAEAHRFGKRIAAHSLNADSIRLAVDAGVDTLEHCNWRDQEGRPAPTDELVALLTSSPTSVVVTMAGIARALLSGRPERVLGELEASRAVSTTGVLADDYHWARALRDAGVNIVLASDAGVRFTPFRRFDETVQCGVEGLGISPAEAVSMATHNAALALGIANEVGLIAPGYIADLVVLDGTDVSDRLGAVRRVYQNGTLVVDGNGLVIPELATRSHHQEESQCPVQ